VTEGVPGSHRRRRERHRRRPEGTPAPGPDAATGVESTEPSAAPVDSASSGPARTGSPSGYERPTGVDRPTGHDKPTGVDRPAGHEKGSTGTFPADVLRPSQPPPPPAAAVADRRPARAEDAAPVPADPAAPVRRRADSERGLRGLVGAGPSQLGVSGALRARDAARPTAEDIEAAERDLVIVRRHYVPPDSLEK
jgi:hypothetical protein